MKKVFLVAGLFALTAVACKKAESTPSKTVDTVEVTVKDTVQVEKTLTVDTIN